MCGITGIYNFNNRKIELNVLKSMNDSIKHRGPDGDGFWLNNSGFVGFGHRRLAILDLTENGKQPMSKFDRYTITYNGEIFNFIEIRNELISFGYEFKTDTDTEVILSAYHKWGSDCLSKFNGMWAFAIWDDYKEQLFIARDHFGIKPLYYLHKKNHCFIFASETNQFKHIKQFKREINHQKLIKNIDNPFQSEGNGETIFEDLNSLNPGSFICLSSGGLVEKKWWNTLDFNIDIPATYQERVEYFRELFLDSIKLRLRSDVQIATSLSGGLDSTSVFGGINFLTNRDDLAIRERIPKNIQKVFSAQFKGTEQDESVYIESAIRYFKADYFFSEISQHDIVDDLIKSTISLDAIYSTPTFMISNLYRAMRSHGITVSMDGHGVDEMMYGYPWLVKDLINEELEIGNNEKAEELTEILCSMTSMGAIASISTSKRDKLKMIMYKSKIKLVNLLKNDNWIKIGHNNNYSSNRINDSLYRNFHYSPLPAILRNFDKASMESGVEVRMPFMDHRLVAYCFKLPKNDKIGGGYTKRILRDSVFGLIPEDIRLRKQKMGFDGPIKEWFNGPLKEFVLDTVGSKDFTESPYWDGRTINNQTKLHYKYDLKIDYRLLWKIINAHIIIQNN